MKNLETPGKTGRVGRAAFFINLQSSPIRLQVMIKSQARSRNCAVTTQYWLVLRTQTTHILLSLFLSDLYV